MMNMDAVYSLLIDCSWVFLTGWGIFLIAACIFEFQHDQL